MSQETAKRPYKRQIRNLLIHKPMQREFTLVLVALLMISSLAIGFVIHDTIREAAFGGGFRFGKINPYEVLSEVRYQLILKVTCILGMTLLVIGGFSVFFLHRVAGPIYKFHQIFMRLNDGIIPEGIKLREGDFYPETAKELDLLLKKLKDEKESISQVKRRLQEIIDKNPDPEILAKAREALDSIGVNWSE